MPAFLHTTDEDLRDLGEGSPPLVEASTGRATGARLLRCLGAGGMATVFLAELDLSRRSDDFAPFTPSRLAVKVMQLSTARELERLGVDPLSYFAREAVALSRVMERAPRTAFVVDFYGSGLVDVERTGGRIRRVPWLAIELIDGGAEGVSLTDRVGRTAEGVDPVRAARLVRGIVEGVEVLHAEGVIHRDLKPDNVLVSGPVGDETPKVADCGIARVSGLATGLPAMTLAYCGPEQCLPSDGMANPLVGPWTDVHALAAVVWFLLGGELWCAPGGEARWLGGERRSLRHAGQLHRVFRDDEGLLAALDEVLRKGAAPRVPAAAWQHPAAPAMTRAAGAIMPCLFAGDERFASIGELGRALLPLLDRAADRWTEDAARQARAPARSRPTQLDRAEAEPPIAPLATVRRLSADVVAGTETSVVDAAVPPVSPGCVVFQPDGRLLARVGARLLYWVKDRPRKVGVAGEWQPLVDRTRWIVRGPRGGFALVGDFHVAWIRGGQMSAIALPAREPAGRAVEAVIGDGRVFGVVLKAKGDGAVRELWTSDDGARWSAPLALPIGGAAAALASGPHGLLVVGAQGSSARALFRGLDGQLTTYSGVAGRPPLTAAVCGAEGLAWGGGHGFVLRFERGAVVSEPLEVEGPAVALGLDLVDVPWLVTDRAVLRRHVGPDGAEWRAYLRARDGEPPFVAIGFSADGARVLDALGGLTLVAPRDLDAWADSPTHLLDAAR